MAKEESREMDRLLTMAASYLVIGSLDGFILSQVINSLWWLNSGEKEKMCEAVSYFENLVRRKRFRQAMQKEMSGITWEIKFSPSEEQDPAPAPAD